MEIDETMTDEVAFVNKESGEETFKFDEQVETIPEETDTQTGTDSASTEDKQDTVSSEEEEQRVPYSRFKSKVAELEEQKSIINELEERLSAIEQAKNDRQTEEDIEIPQDWIELYGDSDIAKRAYRLQVQREEKLQEAAINKAIERIRNQEQEEEIALERNEEVIDENLEQLQESIGRKLTQKQEEDILSIVDEFSPTGPDGKYITLFPFDKAFEIYQLRNAKAVQRTTQQRTQIAGLTGNNSDGEIESSNPNFDRSWDGWRKEL